MSHAINRSRQTGGGLLVSFVAHAALLLLLAFGVGTHVERVLEQSELTEIAYIEARYGEDVAAKVKLKQQPRKRPQPAPPARGVASDSAVKPQQPSAAPPRPEPRPAAVDKRQNKPARTRVETPRLQPAEVRVAEAAAPQIAPPVEQKALTAAPTIQSRSDQPKRKIIDAAKLAGAMAPKQKRDIAVDVGGTLEQASVQTPSTTAFQPQRSGLQSRRGAVLAGDDVITEATDSTRRGGGGAVVEAPAALGGGGLQARSPRTSTYHSPASNLAAAGSASAGAAGGTGVLDVTGPRGGGTAGKKGRKTILDYGDGEGGRGGRLAGRRGALAEPPATRTIVEDTATEAQPKKVLDVDLKGKGVNMTITGQIAGRKILESIAPGYSAKAKKNGWEGAVAVHFTVMADGRVKDNVYFEQTSVHRDLNRAAMAAIKRFRFAPLPADQAAVEQWGVITIVFRLN